MRILHYFLGFPPYRTGGMTKYCLDLMGAQYKNKDVVFALWPGKMSRFSTSIRIKKKEKNKNIENYEIINPLPVPLDEGIKDFSAYTKVSDKQVYKNFLKKISPDIIHVHTLMGIHYEFFIAAKELKIRTLFTSHDYFGLCPKVNLFKFESFCENDNNCKDCILCNVSALSIRKIRMLQSPIYRQLKNFYLVKKVREKHRESFFEKRDLPQLNLEKNKEEQLAEKYRKLREYYLKIFSCFDLIHYNSTLAKNIYERYFIPEKSVTLSITHKNIEDNRKKLKWVPQEKLRITCLAPAKPFKGFCILKEALDELWNEGVRNFQLKLYGKVPDVSPYMVVQKEGFTYEELKSIFSETDILVAASIWYETFGFTVLEALSYCVPVIISNHVGAKDIVGSGGIIVEAGNKEQLKKEIKSLNIEKIKILKSNIKDNVKIKTWEQFLKENYQLYSDRIDF